MADMVHGHAAIISALRTIAATAPVDGVITAAGVRIETRRGRIDVATIYLGEDARLVCAQDAVCIELTGTLPETLLIGLSGRPARDVVDHPLLRIDDLVVTHAEHGTRLRLVLSDAPASMPGRGR